MRDQHQERIGRAITQLREQQGWSQRQLAKWVGLDQSAVSRIEAGRRRISAKELQRFADALHVSADALLHSLPDASATDWPVSAPPPSPSPPPSQSVPPGRPVSAMLSVQSALSAPTGAPRRLISRAEQIARLRYMVPGLAVEEDLDAALAARKTAPGPETGAESIEPETGAAPTVAGAGPEEVSSADASAPHAEYTDQPSLAEPEPSMQLQSPLRRRVGIDGDAVAPPLAAPWVTRAEDIPPEVMAVVRDWFELRRLAGGDEPALAWSTGHSAEGRAARFANPVQPAASGSLGGDVLFDRVARFWRSELHVEPDDGPLPDLVPLLEDGLGIQVIVARVAAREAGSGVDAGTEAASRSVGGRCPPPPP